jgi:peptidoglycan/xylan/chitin deacetylase (PgdA/CDA1 family)
MYHSVSNSKEMYRHPYYHTSTSPEVFAEHMKLLAANGYSAVSIGEAVKILENPVAPNARPSETLSNKRIVITFDDGFRDFYTNAFPALQQFGFTATVFLATGFIDQGLRFNGQACLSWDEVRELKKYGVSFGSHTVNHRVLSTVSKKEFEYELVCSKERIESELGEQVEPFSYPFAFPEANYAHVESLIAILAKSGYRCGVTTRIGTASRDDNVFCLKRIPVNSLDDPLLFAAKLEGAYDWLHSVQTLFKKSRELSAMEF